MATVWVVVVAAGRSMRFGADKPNQVLAGRRVLDWSMEAASAVGDGVVVVVPAGSAEHAEPLATRVVTGSDTRSGSVRNGLAAVPADVDVIVVHDAARPLATARMFAAVVAAVLDDRGEGVAAAVCAVPVVDTLKRVAGGAVVETLVRDGLWAVQTPQAFRASALRAAHRADGEATDDAALIEAAGGRVVVVPGDPANLKLTHPSDLVVAEALLRDRKKTTGAASTTSPLSRKGFSASRRASSFLPGPE